MHNASKQKGVGSLTSFFRWVGYAGLNARPAIDRFYARRLPEKRGEARHLAVVFNTLIGPQLKTWGVLPYLTLKSKPVIMLTAPGPATDPVLKKAGMTLADIDLFEVNEAFAAVAMAAMHDIGIDHARLNVNGGACALGHPIGATGARIVTTLVHALRARGGKRGVASLCIGGGEATAIALELV